MHGGSLQTDRRYNHNITLLQKNGSKGEIRVGIDAYGVGLRKEE